MLPGPPTQARISLLKPFFHRLRIAFIGTAKRLLRGDIQAGQQPAHRRELHADAKFLLDESRHDLPRPQPKVEAILARVFADNPTADLSALLPVELGFWPAGLAQEQGGRTLLLVPAQPRINRGAAQAQRAHHFAGTLAVLNHSPHRDEPQGFQ